MRKFACRRRRDYYIEIEAETHEQAQWKAENMITEEWHGQWSDIEIEEIGGHGEDRNPA